jgi:hypothetical protein
VLCFFITLDVGDVVVVWRPSARLNPKLIWNYQHQHPHCLNKEKKPTSTMSRPSPSTSPSPGPAATNGGATRQSLGPSVRPPPGAAPLSPSPRPQGSTVRPTSELLGNSTSFQTPECMSTSSAPLSLTQSQYLQLKQLTNGLKISRITRLRWSVSAALAFPHRPAYFKC